MLAETSQTSKHSSNSLVKLVRQTFGQRVGHKICNLQRHNNQILPQKNTTSSKARKTHNHPSIMLACMMTSSSWEKYSVHLTIKVLYDRKETTSVSLERFLFLLVIKATMAETQTACWGNAQTSNTLSTNASLLKFKGFQRHKSNTLFNQENSYIWECFPSPLIICKCLCVLHHSRHGILSVCKNTWWLRTKLTRSCTKLSPFFKQLYFWLLQIRRAAPAGFVSIKDKQKWLLVNKKPRTE